MVSDDTQPVALTDNWLLELAGGALNDEFYNVPLARTRKDGKSNQVAADLDLTDSEDSLAEADFYEKIRSDWLAEAWEKITAALQFLDLLVLHDRLLHGKEFSAAWERFDQLRVLKEVLQPVAMDELVDGGSSYWSGTWVPSSKKWESDVIVGGANSYLRAARSLGVSYWPAPRRASVLLDRSSATDSNAFVVQFTQVADESIREIVSAVLDKIRSPAPAVFPGFGSAILQECKNRAEIVEKARNFRLSKEAIDFRRWLSFMEKASRRGDIRELADGLAGLSETIHDTRRSLGLHEDDTPAATLQVGLSPSISFSSKSLKRLSLRGKRGRIHSTFLRDHFDRVLRSADLRVQIERLYPEVIEVEMQSAKESSKDGIAEQSHFIRTRYARR